MEDFKYSLEKYKGRSTRYECPNCKIPQAFARYVDERGNYIADNVGRCNREDKCGYHLTPAEYFRNKGIDYVPTICKEPKPQLPIDYIPEKMMIKSLKTENNLIKWLSNYFTARELYQVIERYRIGDGKNGKIIYWQIDENQDVRTGKIMAYDANTGHRIKDDSHAFDWAHRHIKKDFNLQQCLFGLHLVNKEQKPIALVESEKSAIIASITIPQYTWLATGGKSNFRLMEAVKDRDVTLFPDLGAFENWNTHAINFGFKISDILERKATKEQISNGLDIADFIIKQAS